MKCSEPGISLTRFYGSSTLCAQRYAEDPRVQKLIRNKACQGRSCSRVCGTPEGASPISFFILDNAVG